MGIDDVSQRTIADLISLRGRVAVVTGGARGIGFAIVRRLAEAGAAVVIGDREEAGAVRSAAEIVSGGGRAVGVGSDVSKVQDHEKLARAAVDRFGSLDIWVNNAGIFPFDDAQTMSPDHWERVIAVNLSGSFYGAQAAARVMPERGGVIVNVASIAGFRADGPRLAHYVSSKHGVVGLTKALAVEFGPRKIRVLALAPGFIATEGMREGEAGMRDFVGSADPGRAWAERVPVRRAGVPDDVARVALFCASDLSILMTGSTLLVEGGSRAS
jgi:NAD(P)-dependent dehydrogenase (short-subunit alcohol dehydrogenase family)